MRSRRILIGVVVAVVALAGAAGAWAYDHGQRDTIATGVRIAGIDVGGMDTADARERVRARLLHKLRQPVVATYRGERARLSARRAQVVVDVDGAVEEALERGREGSIFARLGRTLTGGDVDADVAAHVGWSRLAVEHFVAEVGGRFDRAPRDASLDFSPASIDPVTSQDGVAVERRGLRRAVVRALSSPDAQRALPVRTHVVKPKVMTAELAAKYPVVITVDRGNFQLRLWKDLKLAKTYRIAVGSAGLETPAGVYTIQNKAENPVWHVPDSDWAGDLAGTEIPPGPQNPIKARWMGIYDGAGIHGTDAVGSLGTAASHGCIRMAVPDVIDLYDETPVGATVYIA